MKLYQNMHGKCSLSPYICQKTTSKTCIQKCSMLQYICQKTTSKHANKNVRCYNIYVKKQRLNYEKTSPKYHSQLLTVQEDCSYSTVKTYFTTTVFDFLFCSCSMFCFRLLSFFGIACYYRF